MLGGQLRRVPILQLPSRPDLYLLRAAVPEWVLPVGRQLSAVPRPRLQFLFLFWPLHRLLPRTVAAPVLGHLRTVVPHKLLLPACPFLVRPLLRPLPQLCLLHSLVVPTVCRWVPGHFVTLPVHPVHGSSPVPASLLHRPANSAMPALPPLLPQLHISHPLPVMPQRVLRLLISVRVSMSDGHHTASRVVPALWR